jgi:hypothetical protein
LHLVKPEFKDNIFVAFNALVNLLLPLATGFFLEIRSAVKKVQFLLFSMVVLPFGDNFRKLIVYLDFTIENEMFICFSDLDYTGIKKKRG